MKKEEVGFLIADEILDLILEKSEFELLKSKISSQISPYAILESL